MEQLYYMYYNIKPKSAPKGFTIMCFHLKAKKKQKPRQKNNNIDEWGMKYEMEAREKAPKIKQFALNL